MSTPLLELFRHGADASRSAADALAEAFVVAVCFVDSAMPPTVAAAEALNAVVERTEGAVVALIADEGAASEAGIALSSRLRASFVLSGASAESAPETLDRLHELCGHFSPFRVHPDLVLFDAKTMAPTLMHGMPSLRGGRLAATSAADVARWPRDVYTVAAASERPPRSAADSYACRLTSTALLDSGCYSGDPAMVVALRPDAAAARAAELNSACCNVNPPPGDEEEEEEEEEEGAAAAAQADSEIVLPVALLRSLGLKPGDRVTLRGMVDEPPHATEVTLRPVPEEAAEAVPPPPPAAAAAAAAAAATATLPVGFIHATATVAAPAGPPVSLVGAVSAEATHEAIVAAARRFFGVHVDASEASALAASALGEASAAAGGAAGAAASSTQLSAGMQSYLQGYIVRAACRFVPLVPGQLLDVPMGGGGGPARIRMRVTAVKPAHTAVIVAPETRLTVQR